ncbi:MAG: hypothetical protein ACRDGH_03555 [Candidatus Limnocylindria bacterium]
MSRIVMRSGPACILMAAWGRRKVESGHGLAGFALTLLSTLAGAYTADAQTLGHRILFPDSTTISEDDQRAIFDLLGYAVSADGTSLEAMDCGPIYEPGRGERPEGKP